jgi:hypothetical protein
VRHARSLSQLEAEIFELLAFVTYFWHRALHNSYDSYECSREKQAVPSQEAPGAY